MGHKVEYITGVDPDNNGKLHTWTEERFTISPYPVTFNPLQSYVFSPPCYPDKALSQKQHVKTKYDSSGNPTGYLTYQFENLNTLNTRFTPIPSRKIRNIIPISDDVDSDFYGGYLTERHFQLSYDVIPVSKTHVTVVVNRGKFNYKQKPLSGQHGPTGEQLYKNFPLYYGDNSDSAVTGVYTGISHSIPKNYQSRVLAFPFYNVGGPYMLDNDEDIPRDYTKKQFLQTLRFGGKVDEVIPVGNPAIDKEIPSLPAAEEDELLYVFYKNFKEEDLDIGDAQLYPYRRGDSDYEEYFFTLNSIDGKKYKSNKDYIVIVLGSFEFNSGTVLNKRGPFNFNFDSDSSPIYKFGEKKL